jgi:hypothetical protein
MDGSFDELPLVSPTIAASLPSTVALTAVCVGKPLLEYEGCQGFNVYLTSLLGLVVNSSNARLAAGAFLKIAIIALGSSTLIVAPAFLSSQKCGSGLLATSWNGVEGGITISKICAGGGGGDEEGVYILVG